MLYHSRRFYVAHAVVVINVIYLCCDVTTVLLVLRAFDEEFHTASDTSPSRVIVNLPSLRVFRHQVPRCTSHDACETAQKMFPPALLLLASSCDNCYRSALAYVSPSVVLIKASAVFPLSCYFQVFTGLRFPSYFMLGRHAWRNLWISLTLGKVAH